MQEDGASWEEVRLVRRRSEVGGIRGRDGWLEFRRVFFFFFNDTATTEIYTLSLHDALPI